MIDNFRFTELFGGGNAQDRVRGQMIPKPGPTLDYLGELALLVPQEWLVLTSNSDEAFTSENWIVSFFFHDALTFYSKHCETGRFASIR
jgi:dolichyl-diphosphooligosaccharide--protein glycosyltransferase